MTPERYYQELQATPKGAVLAWFEERMRAATMEVAPAQLDEISPWKMTDDGRYANLDSNGNPRFFTVEGRTIAASGREQGEFGQPGIVEVPDPNDKEFNSVGVVSLLVDQVTGDVLVTAAAEPFQAAPGSKPEAYLSLRASVQGSYTNITEHQEKVPFSRHIDLSTYKHLKSSNPGRIQGKIRIGYSIVNKKDVDLSKQPNARWFSINEVDDALQKGAPFNALFDSVYNLYRTSIFGNPGRIGYVARTLATPAKPA